MTNMVNYFLRDVL